MRNPLSAILICADDIIDTLKNHKFSGDEESVASDCIEAANNIALCVQHQKAIVDDILTVSKLDSHLLRITPVPAQPAVVVQRAMAMFRPEVQAKGISFKYVSHKTLQQLDIDWVMLDPSRLLQITINLITNAIKFTQNAPKRLITVHICAHVDQPDFDVPEGFQFVPPRHKVIDFASGEGWGEGPLIFLRIEVRDTGIGLSPQEKALLFERFAQASSRTHVQYGGELWIYRSHVRHTLTSSINAPGSGLGLFISRQLSELHGGQIGVSSEAGVGSTFGFYLKCRRMPSKRPAPPIYSTEPSLESDRAVAEHRLLAVASGLDDKQFDPDMPYPTRGSDTKDDTKDDTSPGTKDDRMHVLVVEDNMVNQKVLFKQLVKAGCVVATANNGVYALRHLEKTKFRNPNGVPLSIILMDCEMPEMDGLTCCRKIREMERSGVVKGHVPIIAVTANIRGGQLDDAKDSGMDDVTGKPFRIPDLLGKMKELLTKLEGG
jgi:signal transduction histidine kinase/CheY-like chemotaxis protein